MKPAACCEFCGEDEQLLIDVRRESQRDYLCIDCFRRSLRAMLGRHLDGEEVERFDVVLSRAQFCFECGAPPAVVVEMRRGLYAVPSMRSASLFYGVNITVEAVKG